MFPDDCAFHVSQSAVTGISRERELSGIIVAEKRPLDAVCVLDLPDAYYSNGLYTDRISVPSSAGVTWVTMLTCSTSASPE